MAVYSRPKGSRCNFRKTRSTMSHERTPKAPELFSPPYVITVDGPIGKLWVASDGALITALSFEALQGRQTKQPKVLLEAEKQLNAYFKGKLKKFELPVQRLGTRFQKLVWTALEDIPYGKAASYKTLGAHIGGRAVGRTVGNACARNPVPIIVPCHRVIGSNGLLTGYVGGLWRKRWLLQHEGALPKELF